MKTALCAFLIMAGLVISAPTLQAAEESAPPPLDNECTKKCDEALEACKSECAKKYGNLAGARADCEKACGFRNESCRKICANIQAVSARTDPDAGKAQPEADAPDKKEATTFFKGGRWSTILKAQSEANVETSDYQSREWQRIWASRPAPAKKPRAQVKSGGDRGLRPVNEIWQIRLGRP